MNRNIAFLAVLVLVLAIAEAWGRAPSGGLYPPTERAYSWRTQILSVAVTDTATTISIPGSSSHGAKAFLIRNDGPSLVYVEPSGTTATSAASWKIDVDDKLGLGDFYTDQIGAVCATGTTAAIQILATY